MFRRATAAFLSLIALLAVAVYFYSVRIGPKDADHYRKLCKKKHTLRSRQALEREPAVQFRENVLKDIWVSKEGERLHFLLSSNRSELILTQKKDKVEAIEKLKGIHAWIQDEVGENDSIQPARWISADEGIYFFPSHRIAVQSVQLDIPKGRLFAGKASAENFDLRSSLKKPVHLILEEPVKIEILEGKNPFSLTAQRAFCDLLSPFSQCQCEEFRFENQVEIHSLKEQSSNFMIKGDLAVYKNDTLTLYPSNPAKPCQIIHGEDRIDTPKIVFDLITDTITCEEPEGLLSERSLRFSANKLVFPREEGKIYLENEVRIWQEGDTERDSKIGIWPGGAQSLSQAKPMPKQQNLESLAMQADLKICGCPTPPEPIFQSRAVCFFVEADQGVVEVDSRLKPASLHLADQIRFVSNRNVNKESFATADALDYNLIDETVILSSIPPKRVLFRQDGLQLSAHEVKAKIADGAIGRVEGKGDVHFSFDLEEQKFIDDFISKYTRLK